MNSNYQQFARDASGKSTRFTRFRSLSEQENKTNGEVRTENGELADAAAIPDEVGINLQDLQDFARLRAGGFKQELPLIDQELP